VSRDEPESATATEEPEPRPEPGPEPESAPEPPSLEFEQLQEAWQRSVLPAVQERSIPAESVLREARPVAYADDELTLEFPAEAEFHRRLAEDPKNATVLREALYQVTGRKLGVLFVLGEKREPEEHEEHTAPSEEDLVALFKETFDAREVDE
jgi:hypothetical protein